MIVVTGRGEAGADPHQSCAAHLAPAAKRTPKRKRRREARVGVGSVRVDDRRTLVIHKRAGSGRWWVLPMLPDEDGRWRTGALDPSPLR